MKQKILLMAGFLAVVSTFAFAQSLYVPNGTAGIGSSSTGNVGIGTINPGDKLQVAGNISMLTGGYVFDVIKSAQVSPWSFLTRPAGWYRIATNAGNRASATFELRENADHSTLVFTVGSSYNSLAGASVTVSSHNWYSSATFKKIRLLTKWTYDPQYIEVYVEPHNNDNQSFWALLRNNLQNDGWNLNAFDTGNVPAGYSVTEYSLDAVFVAAGVGDAKSLRVDRSGNVGIGTATPYAKLHVSDGGYGGKAVSVDGGQLGAETATVTTNYPAVGANGTNYTRNLGFYSYKLPIASGVTDGGYRIGLDIENFVHDSNFLGTLAQQFGLWARVGSYSSGIGTIQNSYGVYIDNLDGPATIVNKYGLYQASSTAKNYFAGNVGIGTTSPNEVLEVAGSGRMFVGNGGGGARKGLLIDAVEDGTYIRLHPYDYGAAASLNMVITPYGGGNVAIGTTTATHKLTVNGTIRAKEVIVDTGWADYVFADDYRLAPLSEVEAHIKEHKHLPGIPSAAQVAEQGVSMGEMQAKMMAKIEELTLHQIEQAKHMCALAERVQQLEGENAELRRNISK